MHVLQLQRTVGNQALARVPTVAGKVTPNPEQAEARLRRRVVAARRRFFSVTLAALNRIRDIRFAAERTIEGASSAVRRRMTSESAPLMRLVNRLGRRAKTPAARSGDQQIYLQVEAAYGQTRSVIDGHRSGAVSALPPMRRAVEELVEDSTRSYADALASAEHAADEATGQPALDPSALIAHLAAIGGVVSRFPGELDSLVAQALSQFEQATKDLVDRTRESFQAVLSSWRATARAAIGMIKDYERYSQAPAPRQLPPVP